MHVGGHVRAVSALRCVALRCVALHALKSCPRPFVCTIYRHTRACETITLQVTAHMSVHMPVHMSVQCCALDVSAHMSTHKHTHISRCTCLRIHVCICLPPVHAHVYSNVHTYASTQVDRVYPAWPHTHQRQLALAFRLARERIHEATCVIHGPNRLRTGSTRPRGYIGPDRIHIGRHLDTRRHVRRHLCSSERLMSRP